MRLSKAIPRLRFERRRLYAQSKVCSPEMRREYRERAEAIGAVLGYIKHQRQRKEHRNAEQMNSAASSGGIQRESTKRLRYPAPESLACRIATGKLFTPKTATHAAWLERKSSLRRRTAADRPEVRAYR